MEGLAIAIFAASICMLVLPALMLGGLGYLALRRGKGGVLGAVIGVAVGLGLGALAVTYTFFESTWSPPLSITFVTPPGYVYDTVILLEDPTAAAEIPWTGAELPFSSRTATMPIPRSGVLRVRSVSDLMVNDRQALLSDGRRMWGMIMQPAPPGLGATQLVVFDFMAYGTNTEPDMSLMTPEAVASVVRTREAER